LSNGNLETIAGVFVYKETRPERAAYLLDALYAWHKQDLFVYVPDRIDRDYRKIDNDEEISPRLALQVGTGSEGGEYNNAKR
jgi:hypothetical protein